MVSSIFIVSSSEHSNGYTLQWHYTVQRAVEALKNIEGGKADDRAMLGVQIYKTLKNAMLGSPPPPIH